MQSSGMRRSLFLLAILGTFLSFSSLRAFAQEGTRGKVVVTVEDASGAVVPGASLKLVEGQTNDTYTAVTTGSGDYSFVNLPIGTYSLTISRTGYASKVYSAVVVEAGQTTDLKAQIAVGSTSQTVNVSGETVPEIQTTSNEIGTAIDAKQIQDLPIYGRDVTSLATIVPGYSGANGEGTFNGLPIEDQGSNMDGMVGNASRMKFDSNIAPAVSPRLEDIEEMSVQTDQLGLNSGFGQASTQVNFVSKRGDNQFHGHVFEDYRNDGLNSNSWLNNAYSNRKSKLIENDFGASVGGPILHDKLFFFGTYAERKIPGSYLATNDVFTSAAQNGTYTYLGSDGTTHTANLLSIAQAHNLPYSINSEVAKQFSAINTAAGSGHLSNSSDPNYQILAWNNGSPETDYFPVARLDYNATQKARLFLSWMMSDYLQPGTTAATFPGSGFSNQVAGNQIKNFTGNFGFDYIFSPRLINQLKVGYLYDATLYAYNAAPLYATEPTINWNYPGASGNMSGQTYQGPIDTYYPIWDFSDSQTLQHGKHTIQYGLSWYKEQDHYWNGPGGYYNYNFGLATGDPAINAFTNSGTSATLPDATTTELGQADSLYAILTGRLSNVNGENSYNIKTKSYAQTGTTSEYPLDEVSSAWSFFGEDSWRITPSLTINYGMRWDIFGPEKDLTGFYHSADQAAIYGPTAVGQLFQPGELNGEADPQIAVHAQPYDPWKVTPQPSVGFAWNPRFDSGPLAALLGGNRTVIRGGYALRRFTEPYQYFWDYATDYGQFYYQQFSLIANNTGAQGTFAPGSLSYGDPLPTFRLSPTAYQPTAAESLYTYTGGPGVNGIQPNLNEPESESWNFGIQRGFRHSMALEVRYNGNHTLHQWIAIDPDEINIFENKFLQDFKNAQANLAAGGGTNFSSSNGNPTPIIDAAFGGPSASDYSNQTFITYLNTGQAGAFASVLAGINGTVPYFCNLVGAGFSPCPNNAGYSGAGAGYPINFFQSNPYTGGYSSGEMVSEGYSNYNGLQVDLRQGAWHGLQYDANYTWSHTLAVESPNSWTGSFNAFTLRNLRQSYSPTVFDIRDVFHANGTYDIPVGRGRTYLSNNRVLDAVLGGYTVGTIVTWQSGAPAYLGGGYLNFNDYGDGGIRLNGVTVKQLQSSVGVHEIQGQPFADLLGTKYLASPTGGGSNTTYIAPNITPGVFGQIAYLHGPRQFYQDMELTKMFPIHEQMNFNLQAAFINLWNHAVFGNADGFGPAPNGSASSFQTSIQSFGFGQSQPTNEGLGFGRLIEFRGNFVF
ncbi:MAG TPA: carboxypeptidase-like regulatory domain-containing protein [Acidobacteriaceae bacterium]|nr:carboxypeptidase-like regulatory domain-containing protein [Acidobacteriaceae bacterium]